VNVDRGQLLGRLLEDVAVIVDLHELALVSGLATGSRYRQLNARRIPQIATGRSRKPQWLRSLKASSAITRERYPCSRPPAT